MLAARTPPNPTRAWVKKRYQGVQCFLCPHTPCLFHSLGPAFLGTVRWCLLLLIPVYLPLDRLVPAVLGRKRVARHTGHPRVVE